MWKKSFELKIDAHPEEGFQSVDICRDGDYWVISGLDIKDLILPNDDNVLSQIIEICHLIIDHPDNPLNNRHLRCPEEDCSAISFYRVGENLFYCYECLTGYAYETDGSYTPLKLKEQPLESASAVDTFPPPVQNTAVSK